ncbi:uncharacterized protein LOC106636053 [Copidosoma floridanum]|uniref:uncharacterized protein LOC106636053 n=1 Tax=Copidosoma floridanum TaxID=29053 RepID=UPI0006C9B1B7|nr:uncharacterized protein LOC106636053 [Copidosoma floridanum]
MPGNEDASREMSQRISELRQALQDLRSELHQEKIELQRMGHESSIRRTDCFRGGSTYMNKWLDKVPFLLLVILHPNAKLECNCFSFASKGDNDAEAPSFSSIRPPYPPSQTMYEVSNQKN